MTKRETTLDFPALTEETTASLSWSRDNPGVLIQGDYAPGTAVEIPISRDDSDWMTRRADLQISDIALNFYTPHYKLDPPPSETTIEDPQLDISDALPLTGTFALWGPAMPGDNASVSEPRDVLFAGETGYLRATLRMRGHTPAILMGGRVVGEDGTMFGTVKDGAVLHPQMTADIAVPVTIPEGMKAGYLPVIFRIDCLLGDEQVTITHKTQLGIAELVDFSIDTQMQQKKRAARHYLSLTADMPQGFRETVACVFDVTWDVMAPGTVPIGLQLQSMSAKIVLPAGYLLADGALPANYYIAFSFGSIVRDIGRKVFQTATAAIMAGLATAGVAATKGLIALAAQGLGPAVGVPVSLVLYSPPVEAWFAKAAVVILGSSGWVVNGELFDQVFPPDNAP